MRVVVVSGPPCAGKTTYINDRRAPGDVVIDFDALAHALGYPTTHVAWPADDHPARRVALRARASAIRAALELDGAGTVVWVISSSLGPINGIPDSTERIVLDPGLEVCLTRVAERGHPYGLAAEVRNWYDRVGADAPSRTW